MATGNYYVRPQDGWVQILTATAKASLRVSAYPHTAPFYIYGDPSVAPANVGVNATGTITLSTATPADGSSVTIGTETYTFKTTPLVTNPFQVARGGSFAVAATNLTAAINANSALVSASNASSVITLTALHPGTQGNYALTESGSNIAVSGSTLTGGVASIGIQVCHKPFRVDNYTTTGNVEKWWVRVVNPHNGGGSGVRIDVHTDGAALV